HQPELDLAQRLIKTASRELREPVKESSEDAKGGTTEEHVVDVRNDEVGVGDLVVEGHHAEHCAIETTDEEHGDEPDGEEHRRVESKPAAVDSSHPVEDLDRRRHGNQCGGGREEGLGYWGQPHREHMMRPDGEAQEADGYPRPGDEGVAKDWL